MISGTCAVISTRGMENQRSQYWSPRKGVYALTAKINAQRDRRPQAHEPTSMLLRLAVGLPVQPAGAQQGVPGHHAEAGEHGERREPVPPASAVGAAFDVDTLQQCAQRDALRERGDDRARGEHEKSQKGSMRRIAPAELEGHAAEHQTQQHGDQRRIQRRLYHDAIRQRKRRHQPTAAEHQPGLVAIPHRCDGVHRRVALAGPTPGRWETGYRCRGRSHP